MHGHVRREAIAPAGVEQITGPVRGSEDTSGIVNGNPAAAMTVNQIALHRLQTYANAESGVSDFGRC
jgi:hypothetical protein